MDPRAGCTHQQVVITTIAVRNATMVPTTFQKKASASLVTLVVSVRTLTACEKFSMSLAAGLKEKPCYNLAIARPKYIVS